jgi:hypothetical protein
LQKQKKKKQKKEKKNKENQTKNPNKQPTKKKLFLARTPYDMLFIN